MIDVDKRYESYLRFLNALYEEAKGSENPLVSMWDIGEKIGTGGEPSVETDDVVNWLVGEGLVRLVAVGGGISLTHHGIKEIEDAKRKPDKDTDHFSPNIIHNVIYNYAPMNNPVFQQGTINSTQNVHLGGSEQKEILQLLDELKKSLESNQIDKDGKEELQKDIGMIEDEINSKKPRRQVIGTIFTRIAQKAKEYASLLTLAGNMSVLASKLISN
ncbi:MAG: hypothetical protein DA330_09300 [Nitrososphaera sp.]|nr:hypothetical protein [Nitrososphaera sp.]